MHSQPTETNWNIFALTCSRSRQPGGCVYVSSSFSVFCPQDISAYSISVYTYIHIIIHAARLYGSFPQSSEQPPLRGQGSSMHHGQDVSRKLLSHNGATSSETFVQIYKNLFELQMEWGQAGTPDLTRALLDRKFINVSNVCWPHPRQHFSTEPEIAYEERMVVVVPGAEEMQKRARYASK